MSIRDMVARHSHFSESKDFIPTPPYATRVLYEVIAPELKNKDLVAWDPAAGKGHMVHTMAEYHDQVIGTDYYDHGPKYRRLDFAKDNFEHADAEDADLFCTNPPYKHLGQFIHNGLDFTNRYLALLCRIQALEGQRRYNGVYKAAPPTRIAVFSDRIPFKTGEVVRSAPKMFTHMWMFWDKRAVRKGLRDPLMWVPPEAQALYEKDSDYDN